MYYGDKRSSLIALMQGLQFSGWKIYGYKEDKSDYMSDYFDPASWDGIAVKNGFILVVDGWGSGSIGGEFIRKSYDYKITQKIAKLQALADNHAATEGERNNALNAIEELSKKVEITELIDTGIEKIEYQANPRGAKWHIEKNGNIIAKGTGVFLFSSLDREFFKETEYYYTDKEEFNYSAGWCPRSEGAGYYNSVPFDKSYTFEDWKKYAIKERETKKKLLDKFFNLINKWNSIATIKLGGGEEEKLTKVIKEVKEYYYEAVPTTEKTNYVTVAKGWRTIGGLNNYNIYKLEVIEGITYGKKLTKKYLGDLKKSVIIKEEPRKNTKGSYIFSLDDDIENGRLTYVKLEKKFIVKKVEKWV